MGPGERTSMWVWEISIPESSLVKAFLFRFGPRNTDTSSLSTRGGVTATPKLASGRPGPSRRLGGADECEELGENGD
jgi:hypothetical protein